MRIEKLRLVRADAEEAAWLRDRLAEESSGLRFEVVGGEGGPILVARPG